MCFDIVLKKYSHNQIKKGSSASFHIKPKYKYMVNLTVKLIPVWSSWFDGTIAYSVSQEHPPICHTMEKITTAKCISSNADLCVNPPEMVLKEFISCEIVVKPSDFVPTMMQEPL